jgi:mannose-1-phosphate guanylyltransferase
MNRLSVPLLWLGDPALGYVYIQRGTICGVGFTADQFIEKPSLNVASLICQ